MIIDFVNLGRVPLNQVPLELTLDESKIKFKKLVELYWERDETKFVNNVLDIRKEGGYENIGVHFFNDTAKFPIDEICHVCEEEQIGRLTNRNFFISTLHEYAVSICLKVCLRCLWTGRFIPYLEYKRRLKDFKRTGSLESFKNVPEPSFKRSIQENEDVPNESNSDFIFTPNFKSLLDSINELKARLSDSENTQIEQRSTIERLQLDIANKATQIECLTKENIQLLNILSVSQKRIFDRKKEDVKASLETLKSQLINLDSNVKLRKIVSGPKLKVCIDIAQISSDQAQINNLKDEISLFFNEDPPTISITGNVLSFLTSSLAKAKAVNKVLGKRNREVWIDDLS